MSGELSGQVAIVTGGASGIGAATVALLAEAGAAVVVADLNAAKDGAGRFVQHDVTSEDSWQALLADVRPGSACRRSIPKACSWAASTPSRA